MIEKFISRKDINGVQLKEGDIVAECKVGEEIWDGEGIVISRPLGVVVIYDTKPIPNQSITEENIYNLKQIRTGSVQITDKAKIFVKTLADKNGIVSLHLSKYDGDFYNWNNVEKVGSVYDLPL